MNYSRPPTDKIQEPNFQTKIQEVQELKQDHL